MGEKYQNNSESSIFCAGSRELICKVMLLW